MAAYVCKHGFVPQVYPPDQVRPCPDCQREDMTASKASEQRVRELESERNAICDAFHIGSAARDPQTLMMNVRNSSRRSSCLSMVEHAVSRIKEEDGEEIEECPLNWGDEPLQYRETFKALWGQLQARAEKAEARAAEAERKVDELWNKCMLCAKANKEFHAQAQAAELDAGRLREVMGDVAAFLVGEGDAAEVAASRLRKALNESEAALRRSAP